MKAGPELFLAWRYFQPKRSAVSVITLISIIGVVLGVAVLIVVLAVMTGFTDHLKGKLMETEAHAQIWKPVPYFDRHPTSGTVGVLSPEEAEEIVKIVRKHGGDALPVLTSSVLLQVNDNFEPKMLIAFDPEADRHPNHGKDGVHSRIPLTDAMKSGSLDMGKNRILISEVIANKFRLAPHDKILLHSPNHLAKLVERDKTTGKYKITENAEMYLPKEYTISGTFSFDKYDFDKDIIFMSLDEADELFGFDYGAAAHIYIWTDDPFNMEAFVNSVRNDLRAAGSHAAIRTWQDKNSRILGVLAVEKNMQFFLLIFIVLVAAFSIANTLITIVIQKTKEIGLLKSMGASSGGIMRIFLLQGFFVGLIGSAGGVALGWLVIHFRMKILYAMRFLTGQEIFPKEIYLFRELPAHIVWSDVAVICVISILLCTCGALVPALRAACLDPAKALRYE